MYETKTHIYLYIYINMYRIMQNQIGTAPADPQHLKVEVAN